jgi:hypothetical protein
LIQILDILEPHLQTSNPELYLPLPEMKDDMYINLQAIWFIDPTPFFEMEEILSTKLNKYELHRRLSTLANQVIQKTAVENWKLISLSLKDKYKKKNQGNVFVKSLQKVFHLDHEFPDTLESFGFWKEDRKRFLIKKINPEITSLSLRQAILGQFEYMRRFSFEIMFPTFQLLNIRFKPQVKLPFPLMEDLKREEKSNGVNAMIVYCFIDILGLEKEKNFPEYENEELRDDFIKIVILINHEIYWHVPWYHSSDRAWLKKNYKEYEKQLKSLCDVHKERITNRMEWEAEKTGKIKNNNLLWSKEDQVLCYDQGITQEVILSLDILSIVKTKKAGSSINSPNLTDWNLVFESCPWKFTSVQKEFIQNWFYARD